MKTNFKKLFVSILACISVVPSANFKVAAIEEEEAEEFDEIVNINTAQDWVDIAGRIDQDEQYTDRKCFSLNNDIVLDIRNFTDLNDADNNISNAFQHMVSLTPDTPGYTPLDTSDPQVIEATDEYAMALIQRPSIDWNCLYGTLDGNNHTITVNGRWMGCLITSIYQGGRITNVKFSNFSDVIGHNWGQIDNCEFTNPNAPNNTFVCENKNPGIILNCRYSGNAIALRNKGTITNCQMIQQNPQHN